MVNLLNMSIHHCHHHPATVKKKKNLLSSRRRRQRKSERTLRCLVLRMMVKNWVRRLILMITSVSLSSTVHELIVKSAKLFKRSRTSLHTRLKLSHWPLVNICASSVMSMRRLLLIKSVNWPVRRIKSTRRSDFKQSSHLIKSTSEATKRH